MDDFSLQLEEGPSGMLVFVNSVDVTDRIRTPAVSAKIYHLANEPRFREMIVGIQRAFAGENGLVAEGRDMGTVVFPDADLKFYLDASLEERARRRKQDLDAQGETLTLEEIESEIRKRDERDLNRAVAPLRKPDDAVVLDTSGLDADGAVEIMAQEARRRGLTD